MCVIARSAHGVISLLFILKEPLVIWFNQTYFPNKQEKMCDFAHVAEVVMLRIQRWPA